MSDTAPHVAARYRAMLMARSGEERFIMGTRMFDAARAMALASFPPGLPAQEIRRRLFARFYGDLPDDQVPPALRSSALPRD